MFVHEIKDDDIAYSESILIDDGVFDKERVDFIRNMNSLDLQSVPGSGKTTALLAKLTILERYMPFNDNKGIVVISHTNAAVNEWKDKIGGYCPKLFSYPNFVGTIQSFVNTYFARPYMQVTYNITDFQVDDDAFAEQILSCFHEVKYDEKYNKVYNLFYGRNISKAEEISKENGKNKNKICEKLICEEVKKLTYNFSDSKFYIKGNSKCLIGNKANPRYQGLKKMLEDTLKQGVIPFDYAYIFAKKFIELNPSILIDIRKRFGFSFVDEMQDMDKTQYDILESCFHNGDIVYQRIGDSNQSIYNEHCDKPDWSDRELVLKISGSHRLTPQIAKVVNQFSVSNDIIIGLNNKTEIKPHLIHFKSGSLDKVIPKYLELYEEYKQCGSIPKVDDAHVGVISWVSKAREDTKLTLASFSDCLPIDKQKNKSKDTFQGELVSLGDSSSCQFPVVYGCILESIVFVLNSNNIEIDDRKCTKLNLFRFLRIEFPDIYDDLNKNLYKWTMQFISKGSKGLIDDIKEFTVNMCKNIDSIDLECLDYFNVDEKLAVGPVARKLTVDKIKPMLGTIHSAKGQTHTATLYLESYYDGHYETEFLNSVFSGRSNCSEIITSFEYEIESTNKEIEKIKREGKTRGIKTRKSKIDGLRRKIIKTQDYAKMIYVGFSRPKYFLCIAVEDTRYQEIDVDEDTWKVVSI
ncbi:UvrD-helicase domain-containing protein [Vibrio parahaemolyticus]|uniref:UvrD-helicase domain-containing protein n=1 Tax=Vibrio parahaemolyticus TaxID=670 RepID=UPI001E5AE863|nr:UvrD-helicase domain-containing protein [Vibrio parahaemolyticus]HCE2124830.1 UvrD-helicase domain-containing protein [Vibrio parahaemolyticus]